MTARSRHTENSAFVKDRASSSRGIITKRQRRGEERAKTRGETRGRGREGRWVEEGIPRRCTEHHATAAERERESEEDEEDEEERRVGAREGATKQKKREDRCSGINQD